MNTGQIISGAGHTLLIAWMLVGGAFRPAPEPFEVSEVSVISTEEFDAMLTAEVAPDTATAVAEPVPPAAEGEPPAVAPPPQDSTPEQSAPETSAAAEPDPAPDVTEVLPPQPAEVTDRAPQMQPPSEDVAALVPEISSRPQPRPAPRVAPEPVARPEPEVKIDDVAQEAAQPDEAAETPREEAVETAPEEAATEIVTEATEPPSRAPDASKRPKSRPPAPQPVEVAQKPVEKPAEKSAEKAAETPAAKPEAPAKTRDAVSDALAEALGGNNEAPRPAASVPSGPPLTGSEKEGLRVAVSNCWNVGSLSSEALRVTVVVLVDMAPDGKPLAGSIRMTSYEGGSASAAEQAFGAARRAILRCQKDGYSLPAEKYDHWRQIEMTFNPEKMRIK